VAVLVAPSLETGQVTERLLVARSMMMRAVLTISDAGDSHLAKAIHRANVILLRH
jgi:hypothetical protein